MIYSSRLWKVTSFPGPIRMSAFVAGLVAAEGHRIGGGSGLRNNRGTVGQLTAIGVIALAVQLAGFAIIVAFASAAASAFVVGVLSLRNADVVDQAPRDRWSR